MTHSWTCDTNSLVLRPHSYADYVAIYGHDMISSFAQIIINIVAGEQKYR